MSDPESDKPVEHGKNPKPDVIPVVGIGASAGGLEAITQLLKNLQTNTCMAFVIVQHLAPKHESVLAELLSKATAMNVSEARDNTSIEENHVYVIPPNEQIAIENGMLKLTPREANPRGQHMPVDYFFKSLATDRKSNAIGIILSGTASDGTLGMKAIKAEGGLTFAQSPETTKYDGMPRSAIAAGCVDFVLSPEEIAAELERVCNHPYVRQLSNQPIEKLMPGSGGEMAQIFTMLRNATGMDFTYYKQNTIKRRIQRRMMMHKIDSLAAYTKYLSETPSEALSLYQDILIKVTEFFRDSEMFEVLSRDVFPALMKDRAPNSPIRIWVTGCSTGEEVYSLAIALMEFLGDAASNHAVQIFATDISEPALDKARAGIYLENIEQELSEARLKRFFARVDGHYQICKPLRDLCIFARQNLTKDPPFSNLDLISCRNVLIYMEPVLQKKILPIFHYALKPSGFLLLGTSETIGTFSEMFDLVDKKLKIYSKKPMLSRRTSFDFGLLHASEPKTLTRQTGETLGFHDVHREADHIILNRFAAAGVVIDENLDVRQFRGDGSRYLQHNPGDASLNLRGMAPEGLLLELRALIHSAKKQDAPARKSPVQFDLRGQHKSISVEVYPLKVPNIKESHFLVLFQDVETNKPALEKNEAHHTEARPGEKSEVEQLRRELATTKEYLHSIIEEQEATNEELQSASEEVLSSNEELQSINEELETAKEELQSTNEELTTLNEELQHRAQQLTHVNTDLINLLDSVTMPIVMLDRNLCIRRFTPLAEKAMNLIPADLGRPIGNIQPNIKIVALEKMILDVMETASVKEQEVQDRNGRWYSLRITPYRTTENKIDGAVLTLVDIDQLKRSMEMLKAARDYAKAIVETVREPLLVLTHEMRVNTANRAFYEMFRVSPKETENLKFFELGNGQWGSLKLRNMLEEVLMRGGTFSDYELSHDFPGIGRREVMLSGRRIQLHDGEDHMILLAIEDVTDRKLSKEQEIALARANAAREEAESANRAKDQFLAVLSHELRTPLSTMLIWIRLLRDGKLDGATSRRALEILERNTNAEVQLVEDLLDISRIIAGKFYIDMRPVELAPILSAAVEAARPAAEAKGLSLETRIDTPDGLVSGDATRLQQVFWNLLTNAIKFTPKGGRVELHMKPRKCSVIGVLPDAAAPALERPPSRPLDYGGTRSYVEITVSDTGKGISPAFATHIFERFSQADNAATREQGGLGLGLAIVRHLVEMHGGRVEARSEGENKGTTVIVCLPIAEGVNGTLTRPMHAPRAVDDFPVVLKGLRVLAVEDDPDSREWLGMVLRRCGADASTAASAHDALASMERQRFDVLVSDIGLGGDNGYTLLKNIRGLPPERGGKIPAVALTAFAREEDRAKAIQAGFHSYLPKPVEPAVLVAAVASAAGRKTD